jgi:hypothetical protein
MRTRLHKHAHTEIRYARQEKRWGVKIGSLRLYKQYAHREERRNSRALINEGLME